MEIRPTFKIELVSKIHWQFSGAKYLSCRLKRAPFSLYAVQTILNEKYRMRTIYSISHFLISPVKYLEKYGLRGETFWKFYENRLQGFQQKSFETLTLIFVVYLKVFGRTNRFYQNRDTFFLVTYNLRCKRSSAVLTFLGTSSWGIGNWTCFHKKCKI